MMNKNWCIRFLITTALLLLFFGGMTFFADPYFHYRGPREGLRYRIYNERYQNDGIVKHFPYDALITGSSMTENFKTSELDALFDVNSVKTAFSGGTFREVNENLRRAFLTHPDLKSIVRGIDCEMLTNDKDRMQYKEYPGYLYDDVPWNDVEYLFNSETLLQDTIYGCFLWTLTGKATTSFDDYNNWNNTFSFGKEAVLADYERPIEAQGPPLVLNRENLVENVTALAAEYPETTFYYYFTPYSIVWFDSLEQRGQLESELEVQEEAAEILLNQKNIRLFGFFDETGLITDLSRYKDIYHHDEDVNSWILECMERGEHELTADNYRQYFEKLRAFYGNYDYDAIFLPESEENDSGEADPV